MYTVLLMTRLELLLKSFSLSDMSSKIISLEQQQMEQQQMEQQQMVSFILFLFALEIKIRRKIPSTQF